MMHEEFKNQKQEEPQRGFAELEFSPGFWENFSQFKQFQIQEIQQNQMIPQIHKQAEIDKLDGQIEAEIEKGKQSFQQKDKDDSDKFHNLKEIFSKKSLSFDEKLQEVFINTNRNSFPSEYQRFILMANYKTDPIEMISLLPNEDYAPKIVLQEQKDLSIRLQHFANTQKQNLHQQEEEESQLINQQQYYIPDIITPFYKNLLSKVNKEFKFNFARNYDEEGTAEEIQQSYKDNQYFKLGSFFRINLTPDYLRFFDIPITENGIWAQKFMKRNPYARYSFKFPYYNVPAEKQQQQELFQQEQEKQNYDTEQLNQNDDQSYNQQQSQNQGEQQQK